LLATSSLTPYQKRMADHHITERARTERLSQIQGELLRRIRPVCLDMPDDLFMELVDAMAAVQLKYEMHEGVMMSSA
jgi:predicted protein tyrosine phosphatase